MSTASLDDTRWRQAEVVLLDIGKSHRLLLGSRMERLRQTAASLHQPREACV